jgi:hypothetical protein
LGLLRSTFFSSAPRFLAKRFQLHALSSRKKGGVVRASKEVLHKLQFFVELLHGGVYGAEFVEQSQTPSNTIDVMVINKINYRLLNFIKGF